MNSHSVVINGHTYYQQNRGNKSTAYMCNGQYFETIEELWIAEMLTLMGVKFMHHVNFVFRLDNHSQMERIWCPDFVFAEPYRWVGKTCNGSVIVGLEAKRSHVRGKSRLQSRALLQARGIPILLVNRGDLEPYYQTSMKLPLKLLDN